MPPGEGAAFANGAAARQPEIERLRAALQEIEALDDRTISDSGKIMRAIATARRALEPKPPTAPE